MRTLKPFNYIVIDNVRTCRRFDFFSDAMNYAREISTGNRKDCLVTMISCLSGKVYFFKTDDYGNSRILDEELNYAD